MCLYTYRDIITKQVTCVYWRRLIFFFFLFFFVGPTKTFLVGLRIGGYSSRPCDIIKFPYPNPTRTRTRTRTAWFSDIVAVLHQVGWNDRLERSPKEQYPTIHLSIAAVIIPSPQCHKNPVRQKKRFSIKSTLTKKIWLSRRIIFKIKHILLQDIY